jgi:hypothetical protein
MPRVTRAGTDDVSYIHKVLILSGVSLSDLWGDQSLDRSWTDRENLINQFLDLRIV